MSDAPNRTAGPERPDSVVAAEYVLTLLSRDEHRAAEARLETSGAFRALVAGWHEDFVRLTESIREVQPPAAIRTRLANFARNESRTATPSRRGRFSAGRLLTGVLGGAAVAAALVLLLVFTLPMVRSPGAGPVFTASIAGDDPVFLVEARFDARAGALSLDRQAGDAAQAGRVQQLWLLPEGATVPVSVALLPQDERVEIALSADLGASIPGGLLEISSEPLGGSPEAGPTGPVLGLGAVEETP